MELVSHLMNVDAVDVFTPPAVYDGRKNLFAPRQLPLGPTDSQEVSGICKSTQIFLLISSTSLMSASPMTPTGVVQVKPQQVVVQGFTRSV